MEDAQGTVSGHVAIITSASSGIGHASARALAADGARVVVNHFRDRIAAEAVVAEITKTGGAAFAIEADVSDETPVEDMFAVPWLASDASGYVTGTTLVVDGGMMLDPAFAEGEGQWADR